MKPNPICRTQDWVMDPIHYYFGLLPEGVGAAKALQIINKEIDMQLKWLNDELILLREIREILNSKN